MKKFGTSLSSFRLVNSLKIQPAGMTTPPFIFMYDHEVQVLGDSPRLSHLCQIKIGSCGRACDPMEEPVGVAWHGFRGLCYFVPQDLFR